MNREHAISDEVFASVQVALSMQENWMVYNGSIYFLEPGDVFFFKNKEEAIEFCESNISDSDHFTMIQVRSVMDLLKQIPYGESLNRHLNHPDVNGLYNSEGNAFTDALIEHIEQHQILNKKMY